MNNQIDEYFRTGIDILKSTQVLNYYKYKIMFDIKIYPNVY